MAKGKLISNALLETRERLELSEQDMAFILGIKEQMYRLYESGGFDKTRSVKKDEILHRLETFPLELEKKILLLQTVYLKLKMGAGISTMKPNQIRKKLNQLHAQIHTRNGKQRSKKLKTKHL